MDIKGDGQIKEPRGRAQNPKWCVHHGGKEKRNKIFQVDEKYCESSNDLQQPWNQAKKQTRTDSTKISGASMTAGELNEFPIVLLNKALVKELHTL